MRTANKPGKLYLIGAGPGDPELLTLKAARILGQCEVVLYDRLVSREVLSLVSTKAELIYVGKHEGEQEHGQARIFELIRTYARNGNTVARLKGGDPLVFGRGAEEWRLAIEDGIEVELIPGITSAVAVPGLAGIPLTYRGVSQSFTVITGHCRKGLDQEGWSREWAKYAAIDTLVVLMGVTNRQSIAAALMAAGRSADEPVAFIERGSMTHERVVTSTLATVAAGGVEVESPAVFVIGDVVRLHNQLRIAPPGATERNPAPRVLELQL